MKLVFTQCGTGIESQQGRGLSHPYRLALGPTQPPVKGVPSPFAGGEAAGRGVHHPPDLASVSKKE
jgi:hypothetical protein